MSWMFDGYFPSPPRTNDEEYFVHDQPDWYLAPSSSSYLSHPEHDYGQPSYHLSGDPHYVAQPSYHFNTEEPYSCSQRSYPLPVGDAYWSQPEPDHILETPHENVDEDYGIHNSDDVGDNYIREARVSYKTDILFSSREELEEWAKKRGREHGCVVVVQRSRPRAVDLGCNRGGEPKLTATIRRTGSIKKGYPFKLKGRHKRVGNFWKLEVVNETHNHDPFVFKEGHAYLRRMADEMVDMVARLHADGLKTSKIGPLLRRQFPEACVIDKDIHNLIESWRRENTVGDTPMQVFKSFLINNGFVYHTRENPATNRVEDVFFCHDTSHEMWRTVPHLLLIDTTYNTNMYKWPFVQFIGVTSLRRKVWDYIHDSWLSRDKEKFVSCWMADRLNFDESTTNRVESQHANLKRHLNGANNTLHALAAYTLELIEAQKIEIGVTFAKSRITLKRDHNLQVFYRLHYKVSIKALTLLEKEYGKLDKMIVSGHTFRHQLRTSMGLPCACEVERHLDTLVPIPLKSIDPFWRKLDFDPVVPQVEEEDFEAEMEELKQKVLIRKDRKQKRSLLSKIWSVLPGNSNKKEPEKREDPCGRPNLNQQTKKVEATRHSSYIPSSYPTSSSQNIDQTSSFLERSRSQSHSQLKMPPPKPSKRSSKKKETGAAIGFPLVVYPVDVAAVNRYKGLVPSWSYPYISRIIDVKPDGNCGFRAIAEGLGMGQNCWREVRVAMKNEMDRNPDWWRERLNTEHPEFFETTRSRLDF
ncbi:uncharacterized protein LOC143551144 [Bidens hawaiensis]|uniref:uncharacterized protein LOC143551144 n=1 Tax=Bidens hawaiensis TaxID=980011 RepID=UPI004049E287